MTKESEQRKVVGSNLRSLRLEAGKSQNELAGALGIVQSSLSNYERGARDLPLSLAVRIAKHLGKPLDALLEEAA